MRCVVLLSVFQNVIFLEMLHLFLRNEATHETKVGFSLLFDNIHFFLSFFNVFNILKKCMQDVYNIIIVFSMNFSL